MWSIGAGIILLIILVYMRVNVVIAAPASISLAAILNKLSPLEILTGEYVEGLTSFIGDFLFVFILGAMLGKVMTKSGGAQTISYYIIKTLGEKRGTSAVLLASGLLAYGGIPTFVLVFTIFPISLSVFKEANLPKYLIPACISGAISTLAIPLPGSPQVHNIIPMDILGTSPIAGALPGVIGVLVSFSLTLLYLEFRGKRVRKAEDGFVDDSSESLEENSELKNPGLVRSVIPLLVVVISLSLMNVSVITALFLGVVTGIILFYNYLSSPLSSLNEGAKDAISPLLVASSAVGFGLTLRSFPAFEALLESIVNLAVDPLITASIITNLGAFIMGSASGGIVLTMSLAGENFFAGADPSLLHRIIVMSSGVIDTVPFNNAYLAILAYSGLSVKETYPDFFVATLLIPAVGLITAIGIAVL